MPDLATASCQGVGGNLVSDKFYHKGEDNIEKVKKIYGNKKAC